MSRLEEMVASKQTHGDEAPVSKQIKAKYLAGKFDSSAYPRVSPAVLEHILRNGTPICTIHDRTRDSKQFYSVFIYEIEDEYTHYLVFEGGFDGGDRFGVGPVF